MKKQEIISRFCNLSTIVGNDQFKNEFAHDCFCYGNGEDKNYFQFDEKILLFIEESVKIAMEKK